MKTFIWFEECEAYIAVAHTIEVAREMILNKRLEELELQNKHHTQRYEQYKEQYRLRDGETEEFKKYSKGVDLQLENQKRWNDNKFEELKKALSREADYVLEPNVSTVLMIDHGNE